MRQITLLAILLAFWSCTPEQPPVAPVPPVSNGAPPAEVEAPVPPEATEAVAETVTEEVKSTPTPKPQALPPAPKAVPPVEPPAPASLPATPPAEEPPVEVKTSVTPVFLQFSLKELNPRTALDREGRKIVLTVPFGTSLSSLTPVFSTNNSRVLLEGAEVNSGTQPLSWNRPLKFRLVSTDGVEEDWIAEVAVTPASRDSKLGSVTMGNAALIPPFDPAVASYSLFLPGDATALTLTAAPSFPKAKMTIQVNDGLSPVPLESGRPLNLALTPGENNLFLKVTAEDGRANTYYVFVVKRR